MSRLATSGEVQALLGRKALAAERHFAHAYIESWVVRLGAVYLLATEALRQLRLV